MPVTGGPTRNISWWPVGSGWRAAGDDGLWSLSGTTATRIWTPPHVIADVYGTYGVDRYATSATLQQQARPDPEVVYVASGATYPDALSGTAAATTAGGGLVLTRPDRLSAPVADYLDDADPAEVVVLGGEGAVSASVERALAAYAPVVRRVAGADRYATAAAVSRDRFVADGGGTVVVASGSTFPDALSAGPAASRWAGPLLLTRADGLPSVTAAEIARLDPDRIVVVGGTTAVSSAVEASLRTSGATVVRVSGADRYATSAAVSLAAFPDRASFVHVADGESFPDSLSAGAAAAVRGGPLLLAQRTRLPASVKAELTRLRPDVAAVVGGPLVDQPAVMDGVQSVWWP